MPYAKIKLNGKNYTTGTLQKLNITELRKLEKWCKIEIKNHTFGSQRDFDFYHFIQYVIKIKSKSKKI